MNIFKLVRPVKNLLVPDEKRYRRIRAGLCRGFEFELNPKNDLWIMFGLYEPELRAHIPKLVRRGDVCWDVGAADGYYTLALARLAAPGKVVAIEPDNARRLALERTLERNGPQGSDVILKDCFLCQGPAPGHRSETMDDLVADGLPPPTFLKMDIEGGEYDALKGGEKTMTAHKPRAVIEVHSARLREDCTSFLEDLDYEVRNISPNTTIYRDTPRLDRSWLVAIPK